MRVKVYNIVWATDMHDPELLDLPYEVHLTLDSDQDPDEDLADVLSDDYGWSVDHFEWDEWDT